MLKKRSGDAGYDLYAMSDRDIVIKRHETVLVPTGERVAITDIDIVGFIKERGSTGSIGMKVSAGVIDSNFRGHIFVAIYNTRNKRIVITDRVEKVKETPFTIYYPMSKAIAQIVLLKMPDVTVNSVDDEVFERDYMNTERGENMLGSTN